MIVCKACLSEGCTGCASSLNTHWSTRHLWAHVCHSCVHSWSGCPRPSVPIVTVTPSQGEAHSEITATCYQSSVQRPGNWTNTTLLGQGSFKTHHRAPLCTVKRNQNLLGANNKWSHTVLTLTLTSASGLQMLNTNKGRGRATYNKHAHMETQWQIHIGTGTVQNNNFNKQIPFLWASSVCLVTDVWVNSVPALRSLRCLS